MIPQDNFSYNESINRTNCRILFWIVYGFHPREICELGELKKHEEMSGHADDFS